MVIENEVPLFLDWFPGAFAYWVLVVAVLFAAGLALSFLFFAAVRGPAMGLRESLQMVVDGVSDLLWISPRRILALARLAVQEAWRRRVWVAIVFFWVILAFSAWFLDSATTEAARLHLSFVLGWSTFLSLMVALFMSVFSLPNDMAKKTIYTVVTKPVRSSEIVLGRIVGFAAVGTGLLLVMAVTSYAFVTFQLRHAHEVLVEELQPPEGSTSGGPVLVGRTSRDMQHRHAVRIFADGRGVTDVVNGHSHEIIVEKGPDGQDRYLVQTPHDMLVARVPIYGALKFRDEAGNETDRAANVGDEWTYRQYIEGGTANAALWRFKGIDVEQFPSGLPLQMSFGVFRTYKGNVEEGIPGEIVLRNPKTRFSVVAAIVRPREFVLNSIRVPRELVSPSGAPVDLFKDLVANGELEVQVRCVPPGQYLGMAQADLYILATQASFRVNLAKGYLGIWLQMLLITAFGVMFSTFLNGPVSMIATLATLLFGYFQHELHVREMVRGEVPGGGPFESLIRMVNQSNVMNELEPGLYRTFAETVDKLFQGVLFVTVSLMPDLQAFSDVAHVTDGFNIPLNNLLVHGAMALGYLAPLVVVGYIILKRREVAK